MLKINRISHQRAAVGQNRGWAPSMPLAGGNNGTTSYCTRCNGICEQIHATWNSLHNWGCSLCQAGKERKAKSIPPQGMILNTEKHHLWGTMGELQHCENDCIHREMCVCVCMREWERKKMRKAREGEREECETPTAAFLPLLAEPAVILMSCFLLWGSSILEGLCLTCMWNGSSMWHYSSKQVSNATTGTLCVWNPLRRAAKHK